MGVRRCVPYFISSTGKEGASCVINQSVWRKSFRRDRETDRESDSEVQREREEIEKERKSGGGGDKTERDQSTRCARWRKMIERQHRRNNGKKKQKKNAKPSRSRTCSLNLSSPGGWRMEMHTLPSGYTARPHAHRTIRRETGEHAQEAHTNRHADNREMHRHRHRHKTQTAAGAQISESASLSSQ